MTKQELNKLERLNNLYKAGLITVKELRIMKRDAVKKNHLRVETMSNDTLSNDDFLDFLERKPAF